MLRWKALRKSVVRGCLQWARKQLALVRREVRLRVWEPRRLKLLGILARRWTLARRRLVLRMLGALRVLMLLTLLRLALRVL